jgi:uncharacterized membrane protein
VNTLIALVYKDESNGKGAFEEIKRLQKMELITLADMALAVKDEKGKVKVTQTLEKQNTGAVAAWGGFWGLLIGLLFLAPIFWGVIGALLGVMMGKTSDLGIDNKFIKEVGDSLDLGGSALFLLVVEATTDKVLDEMKKYGGEVYQTSLSHEDEDKLKAALENEQVSAAAQENLELD